VCCVTSSRCQPGAAGQLCTALVSDPAAEQAAWRGHATHPLHRAAVLHGGVPDPRQPPWRQWLVCHSVLQGKFPMRHSIKPAAVSALMQLQRTCGRRSGSGKVPGFVLAEAEPAASDVGCTYIMLIAACCASGAEVQPAEPPSRLSLPYLSPLVGVHAALPALCAGRCKACSCRFWPHLCFGA
jgi:hypothetical protein